MRVLSTPDVAGYVRANGGVLYVWADTLAASPTVGFLTASTDPPGVDRPFVRFSGPGFDILFDGAGAGVPNELQLSLKGRHRRYVRAFFDGRAFVHGMRT